MNTNILKLLLFIPLPSSLLYYNNYIHWITGICGISIYCIYTCLYKLSYNNVYFALSITPKNYIEPVRGSHKLISYGFSTIHALFISIFSTLYLLNIIDNFDIKQVFFISIAYFFADLYYVIDSTNKLKLIDYLTICHHNVMIIMYYLIFIQINNDLKLENTLLYYMNRGLLAEYAVPTINYAWFLINTKQENTNQMVVSSVLTLVLYFITRVLNFTRLIFNFWYDDLIPAIILMLPLFLVNYYWFYKLCCKAKQVYNKNK